MPDLSTLLIFAAASVALLVTPGPAVFYIVARSLDQGRLAGFVSTLGISTGTLFHIAAAAFGVSALLMTSALAFDVVKYLGAAYLVWLGVQKLRERDVETRPTLRERRSLGRLFVEGALVNLLNPKTALFFFAFLPQFVDASRGSPAAQAIVLGVVYVTLAVATDGLWALLAGTVRDRFMGNRRLVRAQRRLTAGVFITLGVATALAGSGDRR